MTDWFRHGDLFEVMAALDEDAGCLAHGTPERRGPTLCCYWQPHPVTPCSECQAVAERILRRFDAIRAGACPCAECQARPDAKSAWVQSTSVTSADGYATTYSYLRDNVGVVASEGRAVPPDQHRCSGCGHRWEGDLKGAELCGDCWRAGQSAIYGAAVCRVAVPPVEYCRSCDHTHLVGTACWFASDAKPAVNDEFREAVQRLAEYAGPLSITGRPANPMTEIVVNREWFERCVRVMSLSGKWLRIAVPPVVPSGLGLQYGAIPLKAPFPVAPVDSTQPTIDDAIAEHEAAAGCPEDMGCAEYISVLIKQRDEARAALVADMRTRGWYAFCREHQQKVNDRCPRCELEALRAAHAPQPEPEP